MTVYVDNMNAPYGRMIMCHMLGDTPEELHRMADIIGVNRKWYQGDHYDIAMIKRAIAVAHGAIEITYRQAGAMHYRRKITGTLGSPDDVMEWRRNLNKNKE